MDKKYAQFAYSAKNFKIISKTQYMKSF